MTISKKLSVATIALSSLALLSTNVNAKSEGDTFVGLQLGMGTYHNVKNDDSSANAFGGRVYVGQQLLDNVGVELGYTRPGKYSKNGTSISTNAVDLIALASYPLTDVVSVSAGGGVAYSHQKVKGAGLSQTDTTFKPKVAARLDYSLTNNTTLGVSYDYIVGTSKSDKLVADTSLLAVNASYSF